MAFRLNSLKTRMALAMTLVIVAILLANAVYLILIGHRKLRDDIEKQARLFAQLSNEPICVGYDNYYRSGLLKFRELMRELLRPAPDVERIEIIDVNGHLRFDSSELEDAGPQWDPLAKRTIVDPARLEAVRRLETTVTRGRNARGEETLEIVAPYLEAWGRHRLSVAYHVSYRNLRPQLIRQMYATGGLTLLSILVSLAVGAALATRITRPVEELTAGAQDIAEGHFEQRLGIRSNDEIQILAETFNHMTERLKENVEQLEESNKKLAALNEDLKELDRMKSDLLANVSHELRTPLTAIKGYTDYILDRKLGPVTDKQEKGFLVVQRNLDRLSRTINALLDFSRMEMGRVSVNLQPFDLGQLVETILSGLRSELDRKALLASADIAPELPPVIGDRDKISQVLENLVVNALKFTSEGGCITISAGREPRATRPMAHIVVADTGIGIPADQLGKIFNRFHQVDGSTTRRFGGVGLGLAIVKSILDAHGTSIRVESEEGRGTRFRFSLALLERAEAQPRESSEHAREEGGRASV